MTDTDKVRENRLRRAAQRQGLTLAKSRRRDPRAYDWGTYMLVDPSTNFVIALGLQSGYGMSLDEIEKALLDHVQCARCRRRVSIDDDEFSAWEVIDELGHKVVCEDCLTGEEQQDIVADTHK